jgi:hypothetical protein
MANAGRCMLSILCVYYSLIKWYQFSRQDFPFHFVKCLKLRKEECILRKIQFGFSLQNIEAQILHKNTQWVFGSVAFTAHGKMKLV